MKKSVWTKLAAFIGSFIICLIIGNILFAAVLMTQGLGISDIGSMADMVSKITNTTALQVGIGLNHLLTFTGTALLYYLFIREGGLWDSFYLNRKINWKLLGLFLALLIVSYPLIGASGIMLDGVDLPDWMESMDNNFMRTIEGMFSSKTMGAILLNLLIIAVLPAVGEELIFRGILQKELHGLIRNPHVVIFITSFIFSAIHLQAAGFLPKFLISLLLCYTYYWTKSLLYPILLHLFNNGIMTVAMYLTSDQMETMVVEEQATPWPLLIVSIVACAYLIKVITDYLAAQQSEAIT